MEWKTTESMIDGDSEYGVCVYCVCDEVMRKMSRGIEKGETRGTCPPPKLPRWFFSVNSMEFVTLTQIFSVFEFLGALPQTPPGARSLCGQRWGQNPLFCPVRNKFQAMHLKMRWTSPGGQLTEWGWRNEVGTRKRSACRPTAVPAPLTATVLLPKTGILFYYLYGRHRRAAYCNSQTCWY